MCDGFVRFQSPIEAVCNRDEHTECFSFLCFLFLFFPILPTSITRKLECLIALSLVMSFSDCNVKTKTIWFLQTVRVVHVFRYSLLHSYMEDVNENFASIISLKMGKPAGSFAMPMVPCSLRVTRWIVGYATICLHTTSSPCWVAYSHAVRGLSVGVGFAAHDDVIVCLFLFVFETEMACV